MVMMKEGGGEMYHRDADMPYATTGSFESERDLLSAGYDYLSLIFSCITYI